MRHLFHLLHRRSGLPGAVAALLAVLLWAPAAAAAGDAAAGACAVLAPGASPAAERAVAAACAQVDADVWYTWGGGHGARPGPTYGQVDPTDPASDHDPERIGFDCSGLVRHAWAQAAGADILNGVASAQYYTTRAAARFGADRGVAPLLPGDLLVWGTPQKLHHIAVYLGAGRMAEARQSGTRLMVSGVRLGGDYHGAVRVDPVR